MQTESEGLGNVAQSRQLPAAIGETASSAVAAQSKALVEARYVIAMRQPRIWDKVRQDILHECKRPSFAENKSAIYNKPIGKGVEGLGIRFVEMALRCMTNVLVESTMIYEDADKEIQRVSVTDLESNITYPLDVRVSKLVERARPTDDGYYVSVRKNSEGRNVYTVPARDDDMLNARAALISKAIRTLGLRIIPGDIQDQAETIIRETRLDKARADPDGERHKIVNGFAAINVRATDLIEYLGHALDICSPAELVTLRATYGAIRDGETTWTAVIENKREQEGTGPPVDSAVDAVKKRLKAQAEAQARADAAGKPASAVADREKAAESIPEGVRPGDDGAGGPVVGFAPPAAASNVPTPADVKARIGKAETAADIELCRDLARSFPSVVAVELENHIASRQAILNDARAKGRK